MTGAGQDGGKPAASRAVLPWKIVGIIGGSFGAAILTTALLSGPEMAPAAGAGITAGLFGTVSANRRLALLAAAAALGLVTARPHRCGA